MKKKRMFAAAAALFVLLLLSAVPTFAADRTSLSQLLPNRKIIQTAPVGLPTSGGLARLIKGVGLVPQLPTPSARNIGAVLPTSGGDSFPRVIKKVGAALPSAGSGSLPKALKRAGAVFLRRATCWEPADCPNYLSVQMMCCQLW